MPLSRRLLQFLPVFVDDVSVSREADGVQIPGADANPEVVLSRVGLIVHSNPATQQSIAGALTPRRSPDLSSPSQTLITDAIHRNFTSALLIACSVAFIPSSFTRRVTFRISRCSTSTCEEYHFPTRHTRTRPSIKAM